MSADAKKLIAQISAHDDAAIAVLGALDDYRFEDDAQVTPMAAAIRSDNRAALEILLRSKDALEYFPPIEPGKRKIIRHQAGYVSHPTIGQTESYIGGSVGGIDNFERTPLLEACRHAHRDAIEASIDAGAKLTAKDVLNESALTLCLYDGPALAEFFMDCCIRKGKSFSVDEYLLVEIVGDAGLYAKAIEHGRLSKHARQFRFCLSCALLDAGDVERQLDSGHRLTDKARYEYDPLLEALTSSMLHTSNHPAKRKLALPLVRVYEDSKRNHAISSFPADEIEALANGLSERFSVPVDEHDLRVERSLPHDIDPVLMPRAEVERRLAIADRLIERGLPVTRDNPRDPSQLLDSVLCSNEPRLLEKVLDIGVTFDPNELDEDSRVQTAIQWRCFRMVAPLAAMGLKPPRIRGIWLRPYLEYLAWCQKNGIEPVEAPIGRQRYRAAPPPVIDVELVPGFRAIRNSPHRWETVGESALQAALVQADGHTAARLTYSNVYGPVEGVELAVRHSGDDWLEAALVEEIVDRDGDILERAAAEPIEGETPWDGTFEVELPLPPGRQTIEIRVTSPAEGIDEPMIISDWQTIVKS